MVHTAWGFDAATTPAWHGDDCGYIQTKQQQQQKWNVDDYSTGTYY